MNILNILSGPSHKKGGIPVNKKGQPTSRANASGEAEGRESVFDGYVFSNSIINSASGKSFYEESLKYKSRLNDDDIAKTTKKHMLSRLQEEQEAERRKVLQPAVDKFMKKFGGYLPDADAIAFGKNRFGSATHYGGGYPSYKYGGDLKKYEYGGPGDPPPLGPVQEGYQGIDWLGQMFPPIPQVEAPFTGMTKGFVDLGDPFGKEFVPPTNPSAPLKSSSMNNPIGKVGQLVASNPKNMSAFMDTVMPMVPYVGAAYNIARGLSKKEQYQPVQNEYGKEAIAQAKKSMDFDTRDQQRALESGRAGIFNAIRNTGGSRGGLINRMIGAQAGYEQGVERLAGDRERAKASARMGISQTMMGLGEANRAENRYAQDSLLQTNANSRNMTGTGLSQASTITQQMAREKELSSILYQLYGQYDIFQNLLGNGNQ